MIKSLQIKNYAIIDELEINFSKGLTIITGETGAGKSILLGALGLIMGKRADTKSLYDTSRKCVVEAIFAVKKYALQSFFIDNDIDYDDEVVVRRELTPSGKSRAFINDTPVNLKLLQQLNNALIDLHQQFDTLDIHNVSFQLRMIDALAGNSSLLKSYQSVFQEFQRNRRRLQQLIQQSEQAAREVDFINFQLDEFNKAELLPDEQEKLETESERLSNAEGIKRTLSATYQHLGEDEQSVISQLESINISLGSVSKFDPRVEKLQERFNGILIELQDITSEFEQVAEDTEYDGERIQEIQTRLDLLYRLQNKHHVQTNQELLDIQANLQQQLDTYGDMSNEMANLEKEIDQQDEVLRDYAWQLRKSRQKVIPSFEKQVHKRLTLLSMKNARLQVEVKPLEELTSTGLDEINFLFAANKGSRMQMIKDVASGGEISRLTLITKSLVASAIPLPTLIFDEIDTGVSGDVALKMGSILRDLSNEHQIVSITHSPQIASKADTHYFIYKQDKVDRTVTNVRELSLDERVRAIATMLSQNPPSASALENARELLQMAAKV
ncbi:MAG: DNA repair protein RecN [Saprospiraceae bacterium]